MPCCLVLLNPGAEEIETLAVADVLVRAGLEVCVAASAESLVAGSRGLPLAASVPLADCLDRDWDVLYIPGGMGSATYARDHAQIQDLLQAQLASGRILALICAAPLALLPRRLAEGRRLTCYPALRQEVLAQVAEWIDQPVVWDANLVTSQGPGTAIDLGLSLAAHCCGTVVAAEVAQAMLVAWNAE